MKNIINILENVAFGIITAIISIFSAIVTMGAFLLLMAGYLAVFMLCMMALFALIRFIF